MTTITITVDDRLFLTASDLATANSTTEAEYLSGVVNSHLTSHERQAVANYVASRTLTELQPFIDIKSARVDAVETVSAVKAETEAAVSSALAEAEATLNAAKAEAEVIKAEAAALVEGVTPSNKLG